MFAGFCQEPIEQILGSFVIKDVQIEYKDFDDVDFDALREAT